MSAALAYPSAVVEFDSALPRYSDPDEPDTAAARAGQVAKLALCGNGVWNASA